MINPIETRLYDAIDGQVRRLRGYRVKPEDDRTAHHPHALLRGAGRPAIRRGAGD
ncbi:MAG: hypothetical protein U5K36_16975 [Roseovarius sp.]|nr:hypothetical protein [Roseovarius sp.]